MRLKREIKGLKFAKDCDRLTKLKPSDTEEIIDALRYFKYLLSFRLIKIEEEFND